MSYPHLPALRGARAVSPSSLPASISEVRAPRPAIRTRRYEIAYLTEAGTPAVTTRLAPATPDFEQAFSAFARGTLVCTVSGLVAIEDLEPGMQVQTAEGGSETVVWVGSMTAYPANAIPGMTALTLIRITADSFGVGRPMPDVVLGPGARLLLRDPRVRAVTGADAACVPARGFLDGDHVIEVNPVAPVAVYNLALARHAAIRVAGIDVEAYHPGPAGLAAGRDRQMAALFASLFPHLERLGDFGPMAYPRLSEDDLGEILTA